MKIFGEEFPVLRGIELAFVTDHIGPGIVEARINDVVEFPY